MNTTLTSVTPVTTFPLKRYKVQTPGDPHKAQFGDHVATTPEGRFIMHFNYGTETGEYDVDELITGCGCSVIKHEFDCVRRPWSCPRCDQHYDLQLTVLQRVYAPIDPKFRVLSLSIPPQPEPGMESTPRLACNTCLYSYEIPDGVDVPNI